MQDNGIWVFVANCLDVTELQNNDYLNLISQKELFYRSNFIK